MSYLKLKSFLHFQLKGEKNNYFFMTVNRTLASFICNTQFLKQDSWMLTNASQSLLGCDHIIFKCMAWTLAAFVGVIQRCSARVYKELLDVNSLNNRRVILRRDECRGQVRLPFTPGASSPSWHHGLCCAQVSSRAGQCGMKDWPLFWLYSDAATGVSVLMPVCNS